MFQLSGFYCRMSGESMDSACSGSDHTGLPERLVVMG